MRIHLNKILSNLIIYTACPAAITIPISARPE